MQMNLTVLAIGEIEKGVGQTSRREWTRRTFQCFDHGSQVVGSITMYAPEDKLKTYTQANAKYIAEVAVTQGDGGAFEFRVTDLALMTKPQASA